MSENVPNTRTYKDLQAFPDGVNSYVHPQILKDTQVRWAENAVNKGGVWQTRPGYKSILDLCKQDSTSVFGKWWYDNGSPILYPQFFTIFQPTNSTPCIVFCFSGTVFKADIIENGYIGPISIIEGLKFDSRAQQICAISTLQSATIFNKRVTNVDPKRILVIQDGLSKAGYFDGVYAGHSNPEKHYEVDLKGNTLYTSGYNGIRIGSTMAWSGGRLWVFDDNGAGHASDLNDPLHFTEELVLTQVPQFNFGEPVTACIDRGTSGIQDSLLFVFTANATWTLWSGVQDRTQWRTTGDFQRRVFSGVGCVAKKSPVNHMGLLYWYSDAGIVALDSFGTVTSTQALPPIDSEMAYSKRLIAQDRSAICAGYRAGYVFWSVPTGEKSDNGITANGHTQVLDRLTLPVQIGVGSVVPYSVTSWQGVWTGIRPIEWATASVRGETRTLCLSYDYDGSYRVWEAFQGNRSDNGEPIPWAIETKSHPITDSPFDTNLFRHFRMLLEQVYGNLEIRGFWKGMRGHYHKLLDTVVTATPGSIMLNDPQWVPIKNNTQNETFQKQFRDIKSQDNRVLPTGQSVGVESPWGDSVDRAFSLLFRFKGVGALLAYRLAIDINPNYTEGEVVQPESGIKALPEVNNPLAKTGVLPSYTLTDTLAQDSFYPISQTFIEEPYACPVSECPIIPPDNEKIVVIDNPGSAPALSSMMFSDVVMNSESYTEYIISPAIIDRESGTFKFQVKTNGGREITINSITPTGSGSVITTTPLTIDGNPVFIECSGSETSDFVINHTGDNSPFVVNVRIPQYNLVAMDDSRESSTSPFEIFKYAGSWEFQIRAADGGSIVVNNITTPSGDTVQNSMPFTISGSTTTINCTGSNSGDFTIYHNGANSPFIVNATVTPPPARLLAKWPMDDSTESNVAIDYSGSGLDLTFWSDINTVVGSDAYQYFSYIYDNNSVPKYAVNKWGYGYGVPSRGLGRQVGSELLFNEFTFSAWFTPEWVNPPIPFNNGQKLGIFFVEHLGFELGVIYTNWNNGYLYLQDQAGIDGVTAPRYCQVPVTANSEGSDFTHIIWSHIAITYKDGQVEFYVNGILVGTTTVTLSFTPSYPLLTTGALIVGSRARYNPTGHALHLKEFCSNGLSDVRLYDKPITEAQVNTVMNGGNI